MKGYSLALDEILAGLFALGVPLDHGQFFCHVEGEVVVNLWNWVDIPARQNGRACNCDKIYILPQSTTD